MYRKLIQQLNEWNDSKKRKPLLLSGARQTGKTYIVDEFAKQFNNYIKLNFEKDSNLIRLFEDDLDPRKIIVRIENYFGMRILPEDTLIFFDEIQACPMAITALKYFCEEAREYKIIGAGSLLGVSLNRRGKNKSFSFPVGKVDEMRLYPMDFEEFLIANHQEILIETIRDCYEKKKPMDEILHEKALMYYRSYLVVGGMPEAVQEFVESGSYVSAVSIVSQIYNDYLNDTSKYASSSEALKNKACYETIAAQLMKENKNFKYSDVQKGKNAQYFGSAIEWLKNAGIILQSHLVEQPRIPLAFHQDKFIFRIYLCDVGMLRYKTNLSIDSILHDEENDLNGILAENYVAMELKTKKIDLYYWKGKANSEIEFLLEEKNQVIPLEVKAGKRVTSKSLNVYKNNHAVMYGYRVSKKNFGQTDEVISIPLYALFCIEKVQ